MATTSLLTSLLLAALTVFGGCGPAQHSRATPSAQARSIPNIPTRNPWLADSVFPISSFNLARTIPLRISLGESLDIGPAVDFTYRLPCTFTGTIG